MNTIVDTKCGLFSSKQMALINYGPVSCHHEQISGPLHHCDYRQFLFSRGRCILLVPAWRCASFCQWSSEYHSAINQKRNVTWHEGCSWWCATRLNIFRFLLTACFSYRKPFPNVSGVQPSIFVDCFSCSLRIFQVSLEYIWSFDTHLEQEM